MELTSAEQRALRQRFNLNAVIYLVLVLSVFSYIVLGLAIGGPESDGSSAGPDLTLHALFGAAAAIAFGVGYFFRVLQVRRPPAEPLADSPDEAFDRAMSAYTIRHVVGQALAETIALIGFTLYLVGGEEPSLWGFAGASFLAMWLFRPRLEELEAFALAHKEAAA